MAYENQKKYMAVAVCNKLNVANTGTPSVQIKFQTQYDIVNPNQPVEKVLWGSLYLSDATFDRSMEVLSDVFGFTSENIQEINDNTSLFEGVQAIVVTDFEEYQGEMKEKIKFINHPAGGAGKKMEDSEAAQLSMALRNKIKAFHMKNKSNGGSSPALQQRPVQQQRPAPQYKPVGTVQQNNTPEDDSDLPF